MKKTLIALAVATSAAVSGSAMAWTANGTAGSIDFGGTLTPQNVVTPWEIEAGSSLSNLNADIKKGKNFVDIVLNKMVPVLGIRTQNQILFQGERGISPQINYGSAVDLAGFKLGKTTLTLDVNETAGNSKIGTMTATFSAAAIANKSTPDQNVGLFAAKSGDAFFGGLGANATGVLNYLDSLTLLKSVNPTVLDNYVVATNNSGYSESTQFADTAEQYSGAYGSGIASGTIIKITLDSAVQNDTVINWKASLPITVSYQ